MDRQLRQDIAAEVAVAVRETLAKMEGAVADGEL